MAIIRKSLPNGKNEFYVKYDPRVRSKELGYMASCREYKTHSSCTFSERVYRRRRKSL